MNWFQENKYCEFQFRLFFFRCRLKNSDHVHRFSRHFKQSLIFNHVQCFSCLFKLSTLNNKWSLVAFLSLQTSLDTHTIMYTGFSRDALERCKSPYGLKLPEPPTNDYDRRVLQGFQHAPIDAVSKWNSRVYNNAAGDSLTNPGYSWFYFWYIRKGSTTTNYYAASIVDGIFFIHSESDGDILTPFFTKLICVWGIFWLFQKQFQLQCSPGSLITR